MFKKLSFICMAAGLYFMQPAFPCTAFYASQSEFAFFGYNCDFYASEDFSSNIIARFFPPASGKYGWFWIQEQDKEHAITGMNDQGLCFAPLSAPPLAVTNTQSNPVYQGILMQKVLEECATVDEALSCINQYYYAILTLTQLLIADRWGNSVILEGDTIIRKQGFYQVVTNFRQSNPSLGGFPCQRYEKSDAMLKNTYQPTLDISRTILEAVHTEGFVLTCFSIVYNVHKNRIVLYFRGDFEKMILFDLNQELALGEHDYHIASLFADTSESSRVLPVIYRLSQNYPNPFNAETVVEYDLLEPSHIDLVIFDITGHRIKTLVSGYRQPGYHKEHWDGNNEYRAPVPTGVYFYRL
jgi:hypothetical protein